MAVGDDLQMLSYQRLTNDLGKFIPLSQFIHYKMKLNKLLHKGHKIHEKNFAWFAYDYTSA